MKLTKTECAAIMLLLIGAGILTGLFIGRGTAKTLMLPENPSDASARQLSKTESVPLPETEAAQPDGAQLQPVNTALELNSASVEMLVTLHGIGEVLAQRIVDYRDANGGFGSVDELLNVSGIGEKKLEAIRSQVYVDTTVSQMPE